MGTKINIHNSNIVNVGDNANLKDTHLKMTNKGASNIDFSKLAIELNNLTAAFEKYNISGQHTEVIKEMKEAEGAAKEGDIGTVKKKLSPIKDTLIKLARAIGVEMLASWITDEVGL
jgi:hypothetical protein